MQPFKNILFVMDSGGEPKNVLDKAVRIAQHFAARLTVLEVLPVSSRDMHLLKIYVEPEEIRELLVRDRTKKIGGLIEPSQKKDVRISAKVLTGTPFLEIVREVIRNGHDLVITAAESMAGFKGVLFGTTTLHLIRKCPCPVWVIRPKKAMRYSRILAAVDPMPGDDDRNALNHVILRLAASVALLEKGRLHVIHAWDLHGEDILRDSIDLPPDRLAKMVQETGRAHQSWLDALVKSSAPGTPRKNVHLTKGDPRMVIPQQARKMRADLIVMGSVGRTGIAGFLIGNTAEGILQQVDCSVLAVKPEGYISPIKLQ